MDASEEPESMTRRLSPRHRLEPSPRHILPEPEPQTAKRVRIPMGVLLAGALVVSAAGAGLAASLSSAPNTVKSVGSSQTVTFKAVADTYVSQSASKAAYGTSDKLVAGGGSKTTKTTLLRFNVTGIPAGATVKGSLVLRRDSH